MSRSSWTVVWAAFSAGVITTFVQFSIPPILPLIKDHDCDCDMFLFLCYVNSKTGIGKVKRMDQSL